MLPIVDVHELPVSETYQARPVEVSSDLSSFCLGVAIVHALQAGGAGLVAEYKSADAAVSALERAHAASNDATRPSIYSALVEARKSRDAILSAIITQAGIKQ